MALGPNTKLGQYEVVESIGVGGMGEVYRARDPKLGRDVAIKALPEEFSQDRERLERFEREARLLAQLNHPNVATIHGLDEQDGKRFLVMELVEGETLAELMAKGPIAVEEALPLFAKIAEGLGAAHERGIIHRDLKPANVKIAPDGMPKVLDFGLAKAFTAEGEASPDASQSPTLTKGTAMGVIMGTASYMSPEQARGKAIDKRTDVFAFGSVLYEALTGRRAFQGETVTDTLAEVVKSDPDWSQLPSETPASVRKLLERCLRKKAEQRLHDIADARLELEEALAEEPAASPTPGGFSRSHLALAALSGVVLGVIVVRSVSAPPAEAVRPVTRASLNLPEGFRFTTMDNVSGLAISPDGTHLAYLARNGGSNQIFVQRLDSTEPEALEAPADAGMPFFSYDSQWLGFEAGAELQKVALSGGAPVAVAPAEASANPRGASWAPDDTIVYAPYGSRGLWRVAADGGDVEILTENDLDAGEKGHRFPHVLPSGKALLFTLARGDIDSFDDAAIAVLSLDTKEYRVVVEGGARGVYVDSGHLVYARGSSLLAVPFDLETLSTRGSPVPVVTGVFTRPLFGAAAFAVSRSGTLAYVPGQAYLQRNRLVWIGRGGESVPITPDARPYAHLAQAPSSRRLAVNVQGANDGLWIYDLDRDTFTPLVSGFDNVTPIWAPDESRIVFDSNRTGIYDLYSVASDGRGDVELLHAGEYQRRPWSITADGRTLFFVEVHPETNNDIWTLSLNGERQARPLLQTEASESYPRIAPDGRWLAYTSDQSGQDEVYLQPYPGPGRRLQVSTDGGLNPMWSSSGSELVYRSRGRTMVVDVAGHEELALSKPRVLFEAHQARDWFAFGISPDGRRFAMAVWEPMPEPTEIRLVLNWTEELKRLVPPPD